MKPWVIYLLLKSSGEPFYVGASFEIARRMKEHRQTYGKDISYQILQSGDADGREQAEHYWIEYYRMTGHVLYNRTEGGEQGQTHGKETRALLSKIGKGKPKPKGFGEKISKAIKGKPRGWTPKGEQIVKKTQFKKGSNLAASVTSEQWQAIVEKRRQTRLLRPEVEAARIEKINKGKKEKWDALTPEQKSAHGKKTAEGRKRNHTPEELSVIASNNAKAALNKPGARERLGNQVKNWWANLTPEDKADYLARRTEKIREGKRRRN